MLVAVLSTMRHHDGFAGAAATRKERFSRVAQRLNRLCKVREVAVGGGVPQYTWEECHHKWVAVVACMALVAWVRLACVARMLRQQAG